MTDDELFNQMERAAKLALRYQQFVGNGLGDFNFDESFQSNLDMIARFRNSSRGISKVSGTLQLEIYDQFGLDNSDMGLSETPHPSAGRTRLLDGMWAWFILQRVQRNGGNYSPFINHFSDSIKIETTIK